MVAALLVILGQSRHITTPLPSDSVMMTALQVYRQLGMPLPPANAEIVVFPEGSNSDGQTVNLVGPGRQAPGKDRKRTWYA